MKKIDMGFSTCPNDTFIFHAMLHSCIDTGSFNFVHHMFDVEELNRKAYEKKFHITKLSLHAFLKLKETYEILDSGSALGFGCGPLLVGRSGKIPKDAKIAIPGELTTAYLLLQLWKPELENIEVTRFDYILDGVKSGKYDAGLIIHESRFIYPEYGLTKIVDLGQWWEEETGYPIPLGCIAIRKDEPYISYKSDIESILKQSVQYAFDNRNASGDFIKQYAREIDNDVINSHINLYVNDFTLSLGDKGNSAIRILEEMARSKKII